MTHQPLTYMLQSRENRGRKDHFVRDVMLCGLVTWLAIVLLSMGRVDDLAFVTGTGLFVLSLISMFLVVALPMRQLQKDAALHASLFGGRCYDEVLGTRVRSTEIVDQIALHSVTRCLQASARWVALIAILWCLLSPGWALQVLLGAVAWFPLVAAFVLPTSYLAQQLTIYNSQLKNGAAGSLIDSLLSLATVGPMCLLLLVAFIASMFHNFPLTFASCLAYLTLGILVSRRMAIAGIERLPKVRERVQALSRRWLGVRRNPFVFAWSQNPIVVRERARDAGRIPGHFLGALIFQAPLFFAGLLFAWYFDAHEVAFISDSGPFYSVLFLFGLVQFVFASRRASGAIVSEVVSQTMEPMQNTRLHAREFLFGWLQVAAVPRMFENVLIFIPLYYAFGAKSISVGMAALCGLIFVALPMVGAALGLLASYAINREKAARAHSELMMATLFGWFAVASVAGATMSEPTGWLWCAVFFTYAAGIFCLCMAQILRKIEIR